MITYQIYTCISLKQIYRKIIIISNCFIIMVQSQFNQTPVGDSVGVCYRESVYRITGVS